MMGELVVTAFLTLDGVMQSPGSPDEDPSNGFWQGGWVAPYGDADLDRQMTAWFSTAERFLLGRGTYELFATYWPQVASDTSPIAAALNGLPKHVASQSLTGLDWAEAKLIEGDVVDAVIALKAMSVGEVQVHGSHGLVQTLIAADLIDELRLVSFPVVVGSGKRLFEGGYAMAPFVLTGTGVTAAGALMSTYARRSALSPTVGAGDGTSKHARRE